MNKECCVFIHTNPKQMLGAIVAEHALRRNSKHNDRFDVRVINTDDHAFLTAHEGQKYLRDGVERVWLNDDLQSFTPLRLMPPELLNYLGHLSARTKMLHTTRRKTQPWKTGLPVDWRPAERFRLFPPIGWLMRAR